jgi:glyoxylase-like metal-dependent hydrolase (beta-lactamase superfamily II)
MSASLHVLHAGYVGPAEEAGMRVGSSVTFAQHDEAFVIVDPGLVSSPAAILEPLARLGIDPEQVTDVVFSHQHIDHTLNAALFPAARFHDYAAVYQADLWSDSDAEGRALAEDIWLIRTPGHTVEDISTVVRTEAGLVVCTHAWWYQGGPEDDPYAPDPDVLRRSRERILALEPALIVPGHGPAFVPA